MLMRLVPDITATIPPARAMVHCAQAIEQASSSLLRVHAPRSSVIERSDDHRVTLDAEGQLVLNPENRHFRLTPLRSRERVRRRDRRWVDLDGHQTVGRRVRERHTSRCRCPVIEATAQREQRHNDWIAVRAATARMTPMRPRACRREPPAAPVAAAIPCGRARRRPRCRHHAKSRSQLCLLSRSLIARGVTRDSEAFLLHNARRLSGCSALFRRAAQIAYQMRSAVAGSSICSTPNSASASTVAFATAASPGV